MRAMKSTKLKNFATICTRISNNDSTTALIRYLKNSTEQYEILDKKAERTMIDKYMAEDREDELREKLVMHNLRSVFSTAAAYCKKTRDFDNMVGKGLYGLVYASNMFDLYRPIMVQDPNGSTETVPKVDKNGDPVLDADGNPLTDEVVRKIPKVDKDGKIQYVKFITYAKPWIFKMIVDEFQIKQFKIDKASIPLDRVVAPKEMQSSKTRSAATMENFIDGAVSPDYVRPLSSDEILSAAECENVYDSINTYLDSDTELSGTERGIIVDTFWNGLSATEMSKKYNIRQSTVTTVKKKAMDKIRVFLKEKYNINSIGDVLDV